MDRSIPQPAAVLLDFIASKEAPRGYDTIYGNNQNRLPKQITQMSLNELRRNQKSFTGRFGSSASGRYQFMRATLGGLITELGLTGREIFTPDLQDRLAYQLLIRRGYKKYMNGSLGRTGFGKRLAQEWASFPVLASTKGAKRQVARGQSYYAGDGLNKALVSAGDVEKVLSAMRAGGALSLPTQPDGAFTHIGLDARGGDVKVIQKALKSLDFQIGEVDGIFGPITQAAVLDFQARNHLPTTGIVDKATMSALAGAPKRWIDKKRVTETEDDLYKKGSKTLRLAWQTKLASILTIGLGGLGLTNEQLKPFENLGPELAKLLGVNPADGTVSIVQALIGFVQSGVGESGAGKWLLILAVGFFVWNRSDAISARRLKEHQTGSNLRR